MQRFDLRNLNIDELFDEMLTIMDAKVEKEEVAIFLFEIGDFSPVEKASDVLIGAGYTLMNSLKFNEADWTITVKK